MLFEKMYVFTSIFFLETKAINTCEVSAKYLENIYFNESFAFSAQPTDREKDRATDEESGESGEKETEEESQNKRVKEKEERKSDR